MYKEGVYEYIIDNINNLLEQGIDYYKDDSNNRAKLISFYEYINEVETKENKFSGLLNSNNVVNKYIDYNDIEKKTIEINALSDVFMNKLTDIKISVLNIENDLVIITKEEEKDLDATGIIKPIKVIDTIVDDSSNDTSIFDIFRKRNG